MRDVAAEKRTADGTDDRARRAVGDRTADERAGTAADQCAGRAAAMTAVDVMVTLRPRAILCIGGRHRHRQRHGQGGKADNYFTHIGSPWMAGKTACGALCSAADLNGTPPISM